MTKKIITAVAAFVMVFGTFGAYGTVSGNRAVITASAAEIVESGTSHQGQDWTLDDEGTLTITSAGSGKYGRIGEVSGRAKKVVFCEGITKICADAFKGDEELKEIVFPESLTDIDGECFFKCKGLTSVTIPENVKHIGSWAFDNCNNLSDVKILSMDVSIGETAFGVTDMIGENGRYISVEGFTITCYPGSTAEAYAIEHGWGCSIMRKGTSDKGDVNADGTIDIEDAVMVINNINGISVLSDDQSGRADIDNNSTIDIEDAVAIINHINGISLIV